MTISVKELASSIANAIDDGDLNFAINTIINFADSIAYGPASVASTVNVYSSPVLDELCQKIGFKAFGNGTSEADSRAENICRDDDLVIYIASELYRTGGHTAVVEDLIRSRPGKRHLILITDIFNAANRSSIEDRFRDLPVKILWAPLAESIDKLNWLQQSLLANDARASQVFLFNHPQDAVAVAAVQPLLTPSLVFYHHASHIFSLGVHLSYAKHLDYGPASFYNCRNHLGILDNAYLPLTVDGIKDRSKTHSPSDELVTCSSGSEVKFTGTSYEYSYVREVAGLIRSGGGKHVHIGFLSEYYLDQIRQELRALEIDPVRFMHIPWVSSLGMAMHDYNVDIYLDSFPIGGGKAVIEVMASGTPIVAHNNYSSRELSTIDIVYPEAFHWCRLEELHAYLRNLTGAGLSQGALLSRKHYENNHTPEILDNCLEELANGRFNRVPPELGFYRKDSLQSFLDLFGVLASNQNLVGDIHARLSRHREVERTSHHSARGLSDSESAFTPSRIVLAREYLSTPDDALKSTYKRLSQATYQVIHNLDREVLTDEEQNLVAELKNTIAKGFGEDGALQSLLAVMLYERADRLPLPRDLAQIPEWLTLDYLRFLFAAQITCREIQECQQYYQYICDWVDYLHASISNNLDSLLWMNVANVFAGIANFVPVYFNEENLKSIYTKRAEIIDLYLRNSGCDVKYEFPARSSSRKKIRLGVLAENFIPSAETFATLPVYEYLSRDFEVILFSAQQTNHPLEQYCRGSANSFVPLPQEVLAQVEKIRSADLDILFISTNITAVTNQICLLATHRLARVQITSGGSVTTTGIKNMDYFLSGELTDPSPSAQEQYQEKLIKLPGTAQCFSYGDDLSQATVAINRATLGIAADAIVFTSGANFFKLVPELLHSWAQIVAGVPNSVIMLFPYGPNWSNSYPKEAFERQIHQIFAQYGVSPDRVLALDPQPTPNREDIKEFFKLADIYLDSYPFAGTTSLIEPLQVSLPVVARQGNSFRSAMGAAMIQALGMPELVAQSEASYIQMAIDLGNNPELRQQKSLEVEAKMQNNPSFLDSRGYALKVEKVFKEIFEQYNADALEQNLRLREVNVMVFPDWNQSEEAVGMELQQVIQTLATQPASQQTTLLIDTTNIAIEDAEMFISSVTMNLMMEEDLDITEELEIALIEDLSNIQWETLMPKIDARIVMDCDNRVAIGKRSLADLPQLDLATFVRSKEVATI
jgi:predicted O-linked N-acetylglucosamine transferase (SPINDLY family)